MQGNWFGSFDILCICRLVCGKKIVRTENLGNFFSCMFPTLLLEYRNACQCSTYMFDN